ncbi:T9SS type A sorting domain-containing protein [Hymenobacter cellulosilyticus]|uniref:T9SS type A sorting domain-containing protein n=1 Tax=Hymenobacter cellulosilyticus TaxID=2932248 RepID=A0A8T9QCN7_9BACT|nr:T9SS type A sorting domain-containing protein [Hymenobacter cellulosilyticus]UOQ74975.1 T9SS type A sorting domain-containing protein [Hymenobacter cellulosilyticus]
MRADGTLWAWGSNGNGQLGTGTTTREFSPVQIGTATNWTQVSTGSANTAAVRADGTLWTWGDNGTGRLGLGYETPGYVTTPQQADAALVTLSLAASRSSFSAGIRPNGVLVMWGNNNRGQLGNGTTSFTANSRPAPVGTATNWVQVSTGSSHTLAVRADGTLWAWGNNSQGRLGDGTQDDKTSPVQIGTETNWTQVSAGEYHSAALKANGTLWTWGYNVDGQLGDGTLTQRLSPVRVGTGTNWVQISAGNNHNLALQANGTLWAWGNNGGSQLGDGTTNRRSSPVQIGTETNWTQVSAGNNHSAALQANGTLWTWGFNSSGQLGDGTTTVRNAPAQLGAATWVQVSAGFYHTAALRADGTLWTWGYNTGTGQLGDGTIVEKNSPVQEVTLRTDWRQVAAGQNHTLARTSQGFGFLSTGSNNFGQLGDGTTTLSTRFDRVSPLLSVQPLPVELVQFTAQRSSPAQVQLRWATAQELNNAGFGVQKSYDGRSWQRLGFVPGQGTSTAAYRYSYSDQEAGAAYYRLVQQDNDGRESYSPVRFVAGGPVTVQLVPNPATGTVQLLGAPASTAVELLSLQGQVLRRFAAGTAPLDLQGLPAGLYLVRAGQHAVRLVVE